MENHEGKQHHQADPGPVERIGCDTVRADGTIFSTHEKWQDAETVLNAYLYMRDKE